MDVMSTGWSTDNWNFKVEIDYDKCHKCGRCVQQCGWGVYSFNERPFPDDIKCRACHRCVTYCPAHCITIKKNDLALRENANWSSEQRKNVWRQAESGGVMLTGMGNDKPYQSIFDHLVLDACQVTNPSIDPLREPMELRTYLGRKPDSVEVESDGKGGYRLKEGAGVTNNVKLDTPIIFSPMSYGSVSLNVHKSLAMAAERLGILMNTGEGGLHADLYPYGDNVIVQVASGRFGVSPEYLQRGAAIEIKVGQGAKPGIGGHLPGEKINKEVSTTRMIPQGSDAISPGAAPRHLLDRGPAAAHLLAQGGVGLQARRRQDRGRPQRGRHRVGHRAGRRGLRLPRRLQGRHRCRPAIIRDHVGIPLEIAIAVVDQRLRDEGIRNQASIIAAGSIRSSADAAKAIALGADVVAIGSASLMALGCHLCQGCHTGCCSWGLTTQKPELTRRVDPEWGAERLVNLVHAWSHELQEILGALGVNAVESLRGSRERLRAVGLDAQTCEILGVKPAGL